MRGRLRGRGCWRRSRVPGRTAWRRDCGIREEEEEEEGLLGVGEETAIDEEENDRVGQASPYIVQLFLSSSVYFISWCKIILQLNYTTRTSF
jgi:hypothetical protein